MKNNKNLHYRNSKTNCKETTAASIQKEITKIISIISCIVLVIIIELLQELHILAIVRSRKQFGQEQEDRENPAR